MAVATVPTLYPLFIQLNAHIILLSVLSHENGDIVADAILVLKDLIDIDSSTDETLKYSEELTRELLKNNTIEHVVNAIKRLNEEIPEEKQAVFNALGLLENFTEIFLEETCSIIEEKTDFIEWLIKRMRAKEFDDVQHYASEILSILSQNSRAVQLQIGKIDGINSLLHILARYRKVNPASMEEEEFVENIFNCLCVVCPVKENINLFLDAEGLELMKIFIKKKSYCRKGALRLLNFFFMDNFDACVRWLNIGGLGTTFSALMKKPSKKKRGYDENEDEENIISSITSLLKCFRDIEHEDKKQRVIQKFREMQYEKLDRLIELRVKYDLKVKQVDERLALEDDEEIARDEEDEERIYLDRLEAGLLTLHLIDYILTSLCKEDDNIKKEAEKLLKMNNDSWESVLRNLNEYLANMGDDHESSKDEKEYVKSLIDTIEKDIQSSQ